MIISDRDSFSYIVSSSGNIFYSGEGSAACYAKCDTLHGDAKKAKCWTMYWKVPCTWNCSKHPNKPCCKHNRETEARRATCRQNVDKDRASCKKDCDKKGKAGGVLGTGVGSGRKKACKELGLTGAEKRDCARQLRARGWKKGMPIPDDMAGIDEGDMEQYEPDIPEATDEEIEKAGGEPKKGFKFWDENTKRFLLYTGIAAGGIAGISLLIWGIGAMATKK